LSEWIKVIILGIVEGLTEFLPISSTGHLIVTSALLNFNGSLGGTFEIFIQLGAVVAVLVYYSSDLLQQVRAIPQDRQTQNFWLRVVIASVPAAFIGFLLQDFIKRELFKPEVVALSLIIGGVVFLLVERWLKRTQNVDVQTQDAKQITLRQSIIIGLAQLIALIPGVSRSGASIIGGMLAGLNRPAATQFSFYLAIPVLGGATVYELASNLDQLNGTDLVSLLLGALVSGVVAWLSIRWLLRYVARNTFDLFGYYRIIAGVIILLLAQTTIL
jgi:undecaprenyl-diphosphatase